MASASKTPNLDLPQWLETEKPERTDFNAAFDAIDDLIETGSFTPYFTIGNSTTGITHAYQQGYYYKIGKIVMVSILVGLSNKGSESGSVRIQGFPYAISPIIAVFGIPVHSFNASATQPVVIGHGNLLFKAGLDTAMTDADITNSFQVRAHFAYRTT